MSTDVTGLIIAAIGAGILGAITAILKYHSDRQQTADEHDEEIIDKLQVRIAGLEDEHKKCLLDNADLKRRIGFLEGKYGDEP